MANTMTKEDVVTIVAKEAGCSRANAGNAVQAILDAIGDALAKGETVRLRGFGSFTRIDRAGGQGRNPRTGEKIEVAPYALPRFRPATALRERLAA